MDTKTYRNVERMVLDSLAGKYPDAKTPRIITLEGYKDTPPWLQSTIHEEMIDCIGGKLTSGAGLGGTDTIELQQLLSDGEERVSPCNMR